MAAPPLARVLIIGDDGALLEVLQFVLEDAGYRVCVANNGADALRQIASEPVDLVVLDVKMATMSGVEVARQLRSDPATARLPIALHTGIPEAQVRREFTGYDLFMLKADDSEVLLSRIAELIDRSR